MKFKAQIDVMPLKNLLDPQGKAVVQTLHNLKYSDISEVRIGKHIDLAVDAPNIEQAKKITEEVSKKVLINPVMEYYKIKVKEFDEIK